jgi:hypothetical protein
MPPDHLLAAMWKTAAMQDRVDEVPSLPNPDGEDTLVFLDYVDRTPVKVGKPSMDQTQQSIKCM